MLLFTWQKNIQNLPRGGDGGGGGGYDGGGNDRDRELARDYSLSSPNLFGGGGGGGNFDLGNGYSVTPEGDVVSNVREQEPDRGADLRGGDSVGGLRGDTGAYSGMKSEDQAASNRAVAEAVDAAQDERQSQGSESPSFLDHALNVANQIIGITPAEASFAKTQQELDIATEDRALREKINNFNQMLSSGATPQQAAAAYPEVGRLMNISPAVTGFDAASVAAGLSPTTAPPESIAQAAGTYTRPFDIAQAAGTPTAPYELARAAGTPTSSYELAQAAGTPTSPYELSQAAGTPTSPYELARAAGTPTSPYELAMAAGTYTSPFELARAAGTYTTPYDQVSNGTIEGGDTRMQPATPASGFDAASAAAQLAKAIVTSAPSGTTKGAAVDTGRGTVPSPTDKVPIPPIPYRDLGAGNILDNVLKVFGMDTESWINRKASEYEKQGMSPSDAAIQASYDLRDLQMNMQNRDGGGGGRDATQAAQQVAAAATAPAPAAPARVIPKLPGVAAPYVPKGVIPYVPSTGGQQIAAYSDLGAAASVQRQAAYNQAIDNAMRLLGLA